MVWNSGNQVRNTATIGSRTLSLSAEEVFESIRTLHVQTALQANQFSGQRLGWFDVTGIERAVWGARDNWAKFGWPYRLLKGVAIVQDQNYSPHQEVDLYIVRSLTRDGKLLEITAKWRTTPRTRNKPSHPYEPTLPCGTPSSYRPGSSGGTTCGSDNPYIFCGKPRFNEKLFITQTNANARSLLGREDDDRRQWAREHHTERVYARRVDGPHQRCSVPEEVVET